ncbi:hypothetical protein ACQKMI_00970 [Lysinibacillus sp. NPDC097214]|uniref:hypothetical protein n=1 Tax=Lysinibacillus sp. NPDC097214 TaxID=3390584 RepID=UPI003CFD37DE
MSRFAAEAEEAARRSPTGSLALCESEASAIVLSVRKRSDSNSKASSLERKSTLALPKSRILFNMTTSLSFSKIYSFSNIQLLEKLFLCSFSILAPPLKGILQFRNVRLFYLKTTKPSSYNKVSRDGLEVFALGQRN